MSGSEGGSDDDSPGKRRERAESKDSQELDEETRRKQFLAKKRAEAMFGTLDKNEAPATAAGLPRGRPKPSLAAAVMKMQLPEFPDDQPKGLNVLKAQKALQKLQAGSAEKKFKAFRGLDINMIREEMAGPSAAVDEDSEDDVSDTKYGYIGDAASSMEASSKGGPLRKDQISQAGDGEEGRSVKGSQRSGSRKSGKSGGLQSQRSSQGGGSGGSTVPPTPRTRFRQRLERFRKEFSICGIYLWGGEKSGRRLRDILYPEAEFFWAYVVLLLPWGTAVLMMVTVFAAQIERYALIRVPPLTGVQLRAMNTEVVSQLRQAWDVASALPSLSRPVNANDMLILFDLYPSLQAVSFGGVGMERQPREKFTSLGAQLTKPAPPGETIYSWQDVGYAWDVSRKGGDNLVADLIVHVDADGRDEIRVVLMLESPLRVIEGVGDSRSTSGEFASLSANGRLIHSIGTRQEEIYSEEFRLEAPYEGLVLAAQASALVSYNFRVAATSWYAFSAFPAIVLMVLLVRKCAISSVRGYKNRDECWANMMTPGGRVHAAAYRFRAARGGQVYTLTGEMLSARDAKERGLTSAEVRLKRTPRGSEGSGSGRSKGEWNYPY
jgi:hypothetical protein